MNREICSWYIYIEKSGIELCVKRVKRFYDILLSAKYFSHSNIWYELYRKKYKLCNFVSSIEFKLCIIGCFGAIRNIFDTKGLNSKIVSQRLNLLTSIVKM